MLVANEGKDQTAGGKQVFLCCAYGKTMWADHTAPDKRSIFFFFLVGKWYKGLFYFFCSFVMRVFWMLLFLCVYVDQVKKWL